MRLWKRLTGSVQKPQVPIALPRAGSVVTTPRRLTVNEDKTLTDLNAGLMWQAVDDGIERNQEDALIYCSELELAGFNDWRLPTLEEFEVLKAATKESGVNDDHNLESNRDHWTATQGPQAETAFIADGTTMFRTNSFLTTAVRTSEYLPRPLQFPQWTVDQLELAQMLKGFVEKIGVHLPDLDKKVGEMGLMAAPLLRRLLEVDLNGDTGSGVVVAMRAMNPVFALPIIGLALTSEYGSVRNPAIGYLQRNPTRLAKALARQRLKNETRDDFRKDLRSVIEHDGVDPKGWIEYGRGWDYRK